MSMKNLLSRLLIIGIILSSTAAFAQADMKKGSDASQINNNEKLVVVWSSGDKEVAMNMVYMYAFNAKKYGWWKDITFIVWGPSAKLLSTDKELQDYIKKMKENDIVLKACKACVDKYGVAEKLTELGVEVKYMGVELTDFIKEGRHVITF